MTAPAANLYDWVRDGHAAFDLMQTAVRNARFSVRLEMYICAEGEPAQSLRDALADAARRGVHIQVLIDAWGSLLLPDAFWAPLREAGGEVRLFHPLAGGRISQRNHRKLLVCDDTEALTGGFNLMPEADGDGLTRGWCDLGLRVRGPLAAAMGNSFDSMWNLAKAAPPPRFSLLPHRAGKLSLHAPALILASGPGAPVNPIRSALLRDFRRAERLDIATAYFLPTWRLRRALIKAARAGCRIRLLLAGRSDVPMARFAGRRLYARFLRAGLEIYEYQPQILHAKLVRADQVIYVGSANLDSRSLHRNYELLLRIHSPELAGEAETIFENLLRHSRRIDPAAWPRERSLWEKLKEHLAYLTLARLDPWLARFNFRIGR